MFIRKVPSIVPWVFRMDSVNRFALCTFLPSARTVCRTVCWVLLKFSWYIFSSKFLLVLSFDHADIPLPKLVPHVDWPTESLNQMFLTSCVIQDRSPTFKVTGPSGHFDQSAFDDGAFGLSDCWPDALPIRYPIVVCLSSHDKESTFSPTEWAGKQNEKKMKKKRFVDNKTIMWIYVPKQVSIWILTSRVWLWLCILTIFQTACTPCIIV